MDVDLHLILEVFQSAQNGETVSSLDIVFKEPASDVALFSCLAPVIVKVVEPENTSDYSCRVINAEEVLVVLLDIEDHSPSDVHLRQQVLIS